MPRLLLTNDDGIRAPGLAAALAALRDIAEIAVVAPWRERSASSHAITMQSPLRLHDVEGRGLAVDGTPCDCVFYALEQLYGSSPPDLVVSGINAGGNLGQDVLYSGTVAAALDAARRGVPAVAISLVGYHDLDFDPAAQFLRALVTEVLDRGLPTGIALNVNVPKHARPPLRYAVTELGQHGYRDVVEQRRDPRGRPYFWLGGQWAGYRSIVGSDCDAIGSGTVSITPLHSDLCARNALPTLRSWEIDGYLQAAP